MAEERKTKRELVREIAKRLTLENPKVLERLQKECESGSIAVAIFIELLHFGWGVPKQKIEVEAGAGLLQLTTRRPLGFDPLRPDEPMTKIIEARYGVLPALATDEAEPGAAAAVAPPAPAKPQASIVPRAAPAKQAPKKQIAKPKPPEDDGTSTLHVEGV